MFLLMLACVLLTLTLFVAGIAVCAQIKEQVRYLDTAFSMVKVPATKTDEEQESTGQSGALSASLAANEVSPSLP